MDGVVWVECPGICHKSPAGGACRAGQAGGFGLFLLAFNAYGYWRKLCLMWPGLQLNRVILLTLKRMKKPRGMIIDE